MKKIIGDKAFYKMVFMVAVPIIVQNGITNFVGLLDNIMVGRVGTEQMSGVAIVNQLLLIYNLSIFGAISGAGIFGAQFFGCKDHKGVRHIFRFKMYSCLLITIVGMVILYFFGENLIRLYLHDEGGGQSLQAALTYGKQYLAVMIFGLLPFGVEQVYTSTLRECGETVVPMKAGVTAVLINGVLNFVLIFGYLGFPALGVVGAAVATCVSRYIQSAIVIIWTHTHEKQNIFIQGVYSSPRIPVNLCTKVILCGFPLLINEILWSAGMASLMQCYSVRGLDTVAAINISSTITNLFNIVFMAMGSAISIMVGQLLGANKLKEAQETDAKLIACSVMSCVIMGMLLWMCAPFFPRLYNTSESVKVLASSFMRVAAFCMPIHGFAHASYFTLRSGGKTFITFLFDSVFVWGVNFPTAYILSRFTGMPVVPLYFICQFTDIIKCVIGFILIKKGVWLNNLIGEEAFPNKKKQL